MNTGEGIALGVGILAVSVLGFFGVKEYLKEKCVGTWSGDLLTGSCSTSVPANQLAPPTNINVTYNSTSTQGTITWDAVSGASTYTVTVNGSQVYSGSALICTFTSTPSTQYSIAVTACP